MDRIIETIYYLKNDANVGMVRIDAPNYAEVYNLLRAYHGNHCSQSQLYEAFYSIAINYFQNYNWKLIYDTTNADDKQIMVYLSFELKGQP
jgi:cytidylate kinase